MKEFFLESFSEVKWYEEDLANALECCDMPVTENNMEKLRNIVDCHWFVDYMIQAGFEYMYNAIGVGDGWDKE